jgi:two-component sensor histidine kinase
MTLRSRPIQRLGFRLAFLFAIALLPLGIISALQARALLEQTRARSEAALLGETRLAASAEIRAIQRAQGAAEALAQTVPDVLDNLELCNAIMADVAEDSALISFASYYDLRGYSPCNSTRDSVDFGLTDNIRAAVSDPVPSVAVNRSPRVSKNSVLIARHPVTSDDGELIGFTSISVPHSTLRSEKIENGKQIPLMLLTFNGEGDVITSSVGFERYEKMLPKDRSLAAFVGSRSVAFTADGNDDRKYTYSVVPLVPGALYALGSWSAAALPGALSLSALPPVVVPALMWLVSLAVAVIAAERLVVRHIKKLTRAITTFARGDRIIGDLNLSEAPGEIRAAGDAFETMTASILRDEAELENTLHQKEVLLREVHHRVKNNLQLIASIMNMQARRAHTPEAKIMVRRLQDRVMSLATIHRGLYQTSGLADVSADELLQDILSQIVNMAAGPGHSFEVRSDFEPIRLTPDQAVPLALLVTEALTNAMKYASVEKGRARLDLSLRKEGQEQAVLVVKNSIPAEGQVRSDRGDAEPSGLGTHLVQAFVGQLGGTQQRDISASQYTLTVRFPIRPLEGGEARERSDEPEIPASDAAE